MATNVILNYTVASPNTNIYTAFNAINVSNYETEGRIDGFFVKSAVSPTSIQISYSETANTKTSSIVPSDVGDLIGIAAISAGGELRSLSLTGDTPLVLPVEPNPSLSIRFDLVCIKINDTAGALGAEIVVVEGTAALDPDLTILESATIKYLPIARIKVPASNGNILQADIEQIGESNSGDFRPFGLAAKNRPAQSVRIIDNATEAILPLVDGDIWINDDDGGIRFKKGTTEIIRSSREIFKGNAHNFGSVGAGVTSTKIYSTADGQAGFNTLTVPLASLKVGDVFRILVGGPSTFAGNFSLVGSPTTQVTLDFQIEIGQSIASVGASPTYEIVVPWSNIFKINTSGLAGTFQVSSPNDWTPPPAYVDVTVLRDGVLDTLCHYQERQINHTGPGSTTSVQYVGVSPFKTGNTESLFGLGPNIFFRISNRMVMGANISVAGSTFCHPVTITKIS